ncbi:MAG: GPP34 family phosphoprotein [Mycobacteriaceae bacterium]|nr:GPP34 family phosphoprotein [Mycobacteriaceae bacterium]
MAQIAEDLLLLLLDNAANRPALTRDRREKVLSAAVLLDLALACRIRPSVDGEPVPAGRLLLLTGPDLGDPILDAAMRLLHRRPLKPHAAVAKLRRGIEPAMLRHLEQTGDIRPIQLRGNRFNGSRAWPIADRSRVDRARSALIAALFEPANPAPTTAAIISLLYPVHGLDALLSLNERGREWVNSRAADIAGGCWVDEATAGLDQMNLVVTASAVRTALT